MSLQIYTKNKHIKYLVAQENCFESSDLEMKTSLSNKI